MVGIVVGSVVCIDGKSGSGFVGSGDKGVFNDFGVLFFCYIIINVGLFCFVNIVYKGIVVVLFGFIVFV